LPAARTQLADQPGTPAHTVPRTIFKTPEERAADLLTAQTQTRGRLATEAGATPRQVQTGTLKALGMLPTTSTTGHFMGNVLGEEATDETGQPALDSAGRPLVRGQMYRHVQDPEGHSVFTPISASSAATPKYVVATVDPTTHQRDMTGAGTRQGRFQVVPATPENPDGFKFVGFTNPGPRETATTIQWDDDAGHHIENVYQPVRFDQQGVTPPPTAGAPPSPSGTPPRVGGAPPAPTAAAAPPVSGPVREPVVTAPPDLKIAHVRLPSGAVIEARETPKSHTYIDRNGQPIPGASAASATEAATQQELMSNLGTISGGLKDIEELTRKVYPPGAGLLGGLKSGAVLAAKNLGRDPDMAKLTNRVSLSAGPVARIVEMSNRMNLAVVKRAAEALGDPHSGLLSSASQEEALAKIQAVKDALRQQLDQMGIVIDPNGHPHQFNTREQMDAFKAVIAKNSGGQ